MKTVRLILIAMTVAAIFVFSGAGMADSPTAGAVVPGQTPDKFLRSGVGGVCLGTTDFASCQACCTKTYGLFGHGDALYTPPNTCQCVCAGTSCI